jgi:cell fate regulator YaaT (PSP1 superfamily)
MVKIIGVNFRNGGKIYYFSPGENIVKVGQKVIVETSRGIEMGTVLLGIREMEEEKVTQPLKEIIRIAEEEDFLHIEENKKKEKEALAICQEKIEKHGLAMKLIACEYTFENNKILFYFTADGRIDFRELVKDLASVFRTRIELRQIGVRDETKMLGGIGICGRELCCKAFLTDFVPVSIRMAKEQNLSLNPTKISGTCGRLMCCLKNEEETYEYLNARLPVVGEFVLHKSDNTHGKVYSVDVLRQKVKVVVSLPGDDLEIREYPVDELRFKPRTRYNDDLDDLELTDEMRALDEELSRVKAEHAEAEAAASANTKQEKTETVHRKDNTAYQQAIKAARENDAAEKAEREERAARFAAAGHDNTRHSSRPEYDGVSNNHSGDNNKRNQQHQRYGYGPNGKDGSHEKYQSGRVRSFDKDRRSQHDTLSKGTQQAKNYPYGKNENLQYNKNNEKNVGNDPDSKRNHRGSAPHGSFSQSGHYPDSKGNWNGKDGWNNKDSWKKNHESFHSQKKRNGLRYSSRKNTYNPSTDHRDDD